MDTASGRPVPLVRPVMLDIQDKMLLFHTRDLRNPELGTWWRFYPASCPHYSEPFLMGRKSTNRLNCGHNHLKVVIDPGPDDCSCKLTS